LLLVLFCFILTCFQKGLHIDQNIWQKPDLCCVQGMIPLYDVTEGTGGLAVVPKSHLDGKALANRHEHWRLGGDFCVLAKSDPFQTQKKLILAKAG